MPSKLQSSLALFIGLLAAGCGAGPGDASGASKAGSGTGAAAVPSAVLAADTQPAVPDAAAPSAGSVGAATTSPAAGPSAGGAGELMQDKTVMAGYGSETYRMVDEKDEVVSVLKNGLVVIAKRVPSPVCSVRGYAFTGGVFEGKWLGGGLSHLLEHLVAGGSNGRRTEAENRDLLQKLGNNSNAFTNYDQTAFFVNTTTDRMEPAVDLVTGWMLTAQITVPEYRREYEVVQRELEMGKGEPDRVFYYITQSNRYRVNPARVPVIGYQEVIQGLSRDDVYNYYKMAYVPNNMMFVVAGNLEPEKMLAAVQKYVADAKPGRVFSHDIAPEPPVLTPRTVVCAFPRLGQAKLQLGFPSVSLNSPDLFALDLLATILGGGESSTLVEQVRDDKQLVSGIDVSDDTPSYASGTFAVDMELAPEKIADATEAVLKMLEEIKDKPIDAERIARAKTQMKADRVKKLQTTEDIGDSLAQDYMSTGDPHFSDRYVEKVQEVTAAQLQEVARKYLVRGRLLTTAMFPSDYVGAEGLPRAQDLLRPVVAPTTQPGAATVASPIVKVQLDNGTTLLTRRISTSPLVVVQLYSLGGLTAEDEKTNGLGNLAMQMVTRGTKTRNAQQIAEFFDSIGGDIETACGNNSWYWKATCLKSDFSKAMEVYGDLVNEPAFAESELRPMKERMAAAIAGEDSDWTAQASRFFKKEFYSPLHSPYQFPIAGSEQNIKLFSAQQVSDWYHQKVLGGKKVLAIFGDIDPTEAERVARAYLDNGARHAGAGHAETEDKPASGDPVAGVAPAKGVADENATPDVTVTRVAVNKTEQALAGVVIGYKSDSVIGEPDTYPIDVGQTMAGGYTYPTGYIFETLRGRGLVYVAQASNSPGRPGFPGTFITFAGCDPKNVNEVVDVMLENIARLQGTPADINLDWFKRSKELIVVADAMENETPSEQAAMAALDELDGLGYTWHQSFADKVRGVELSEVRRVARARLRECVVTISTPSPQKVTVHAGRREYTSFAPVDLTPRGVQHDTGGAK
jgi:zinc protease